MKKNKLLFILCWTLYFASYIGRKNYPALMSQMILEKFLTETQAGSINTIFFISYAVGQLINGYLGDRFRSDRLILIGTLLGGFCNLAMGLSSSYRMMPFIWALNGYALSMLWAPMLRLFALQMEPEECTRYTVHMAAACSLGAVGSSLLCALLVAVIGWRSAFIVSAVCLLIPGITWMLLSSSVVTLTTAAPVKVSDNTHHSLSMFWTLPMILTLIVILIQGMLRDGISSWVPTMITAQFNTPPSLSILMSTILPIITLIGPYAAHYVYQKWKISEIQTSLLFFIGAVVASIIIRISMRLPAAITVLSFAVITACMEAVNVMFLSILPLRYVDEGRTSTMTGLFNFTTYMGSALSAYTSGMIVEGYGWSAAILTWILLGILGLILCIILSYNHHKV